MTILCFAEETNNLFHARRDNNSTGLSWELRQWKKGWKSSIELLSEILRDHRNFLTPGGCVNLLCQRDVQEKFVLLFY